MSTETRPLRLGPTRRPLRLGPTRVTFNGRDYSAFVVHDEISLSPTPSLLGGIPIHTSEQIPPGTIGVMHDGELQLHALDYRGIERMLDSAFDGTGDFNAVVIDSLAQTFQASVMDELINGRTGDTAPLPRQEYPDDPLDAFGEEPDTAPSWFAPLLAQFERDIREHRADYPRLPFTPECRHVQQHETRTIRTIRDLARYMIFCARGWDRQGYCWHYIPRYLHCQFGVPPMRTTGERLDVTSIGHAPYCDLAGRAAAAATVEYSDGHTEHCTCGAAQTNEHLRREREAWTTASFT